MCSEYKELGLREESYCLLDSDGVGNLDPYTSVCRFDRLGSATTIINHNRQRMFDANNGEFPLVIKPVVPIERFGNCITKGLCCLVQIES